MEKWQWHDILRDSIVTVTFEKANGEKRDMRCTLMNSIVPGDDLSRIPKRASDSNPNVVACWDVEAEGWRSFRISSVIGWEEI